ncbi:hypothetical protein THARTR1_09795 [Trichoderma harzianum]|uniref:Uncharacterized protein n=1 Tax=Trichoderma harzianum TaxID=5544 RepID=A0A2K0TVA7_TRIHA|nr:hypothetical protein THARTR1_09795 [Trichoderma harzianum]
MYGREHLRLPPQCGICGDGIETDDMVVALYVSYDNSVIYRCSRPFGFPSRDPTLCPGPRPLSFYSRELLVTFRAVYDKIRNGFCEANDCTTCDLSPETAAAHLGCYEIVTNKCRVDDKQVLHRRLLALALWKRPWRAAKPLFLPSRVDRAMLNIAADMFGLPQLRELPVELLDMIWGYSAPSLFWRSIEALRVAAYVSDMTDESQQPQVVPLWHVVSWERGGKLHERNSRTLPPVIRLTIDSDGISKIERLASHPRYSRGNHTHTAYIVGCHKDEQLSTGINVEIADGHLRLKLPRRLPPKLRALHIWNTPAPPPLSPCHLSPHNPYATWARLFAVDPDTIRGITFFYDHEYLCAIHIHYPQGPSAQSTYDQIKDDARRKMIWLYLPIPRGDRLTVIGARQQRNTVCHLFRLEKSGDVAIGARLGSSSEDQCLARGAPLTLICGEPNRADEGTQVDFVGTYCGTESQSSRQSSKELRLPDDFPLDKYESSPVTEGTRSQTEFFSWAPLDRVASALVFRDQATGCCRGILFHYLNGGSRAVGECRLDVDPAQRVAGPGLVCVQTESRPSTWHPSLSQYRTRVTFQHGSQHDHHEHGHEQPVDGEWSVDKEWKCYPMAGFIKLWCTAEGSLYMSITAEQHMETDGSPKLDA